MDYSSYYVVAKNDLDYLEFSIALVDKAPNFNNMIIQEQQVCEKMLKHLVKTFVFSFLTDFYFDGRYPSIDFLAASKEDVLKGYEIVKIVVKETERMLAEYRMPLKSVEAFDKE